LIYAFVYDPVVMDAHQVIGAPVANPAEEHDGEGADNNRCSAFKDRWATSPSDHTQYVDMDYALTAPGQGSNYWEFVSADGKITKRVTLPSGRDAARGEYTLANDVGILYVRHGLGPNQNDLLKHGDSNLVVSSDAFHYGLGNTQGGAVYAVNGANCLRSVSSTLPQAGYQNRELPLVEQVEIYNAATNFSAWLAFSQSSANDVDGDGLTNQQETSLGSNHENADTDGDGMGDGFENQYFGSPTGGDPNADPDSDGRTNLQESQSGTNPLVHNGTPLAANFTGTPTSGPAPFLVTFTDTSTGSITNRFWNFGDGSTTNTAATGVSHTYNLPGTNTVTLTVTGPAGSNTLARSSYIRVTGAAAAAVTLRVGVTNIGSGANFLLPLVAECGTNVLGGYDVTLSFDTNVLRLTAISGGATEFSSPLVSTNVPGQVGILDLNLISVTGPTGAVVVANLSFTAIGAAGSSSPVTFPEAMAFDTDGNDLATDSINGQVNVIAPPQLVVTPASRDFGTVSVGQSSTQSFQVINTGELSLSGSATAGGPFVVASGNPYHVAPGQTSVVQVAFTPGTGGSFSNAVVFTSSGGSSTNPVTGTGLGVVYPPGDVNGTNGVTGADSLLINQVLVGLRSNTHPVFAAAGFANGDVNTNGVTSGADSLLINQVLVGLRAYIVTKILPLAHASNQTTAVTIYGIGFPTNVTPTVTIGAPVNLTLTNPVVVSREQILATVPPGGGLGTGIVSVVSSPTNGVISFGRFINQ
jgi:PKD repeat protein